MATLATGSTMNSVPILALPSGTVMCFQQTSSPTGWTKITSYNDAHIRIVNGSVSTGGSVSFSSCMSLQAVGGTVTVTTNAMTLSTGQMPSHAHWCSAANIDDYNFSGSSGNGQNHGLVSDAGGYTSNDPNYGAGRYGQGSGGGSSHDHGQVSAGFSGNNIDLRIKYVDCILASKS